MKEQMLLLLLICISGCACFNAMSRVQGPSYPGGFSDIRFERTLEQTVKEVEQDARRVTVRFSECNFRDGMRQLTELTGVPISWDRSLDNEVIDGVFIDKPLDEVLDFLSRRMNVQVIEQQGMYFMGTVREGDTVSAVIRVPPIARNELDTALKAFSDGKATIIGSFIWITDTFDNVRKLVADLEVIRERSERSYLAEVFFIRVNEDDFLRLTANLRINQVDIFSSAFNISQLFSMFVDADGKLGSTVIDTRPVLLLSEGRKATFEVGSEITRERRSVTETGIISTMGYDKFQDGILYRSPLEIV